MDELVQWLGEILDTDEEWARAAAAEYGAVWTADVQLGAVTSDTGTDVVSEPNTPVDHIAEYDPARALREIDAKRQLIAQHRPVGYGNVCLSYCHTRTPSEPQTWPCLTLRLLALPYADRPGYLESWRP